MQLIEMEESIKTADNNLELLMRLSVILTYPHIKEYINEIHEIREALEDTIDDEQKMEITSRIKNKVQKEAIQALHEADNNGAIYVATAVGKSKIGVDQCSYLVDRYEGLKPSTSILIVVPTEKLRDEGWHEEFKKWGVEDIWDKHVSIECYASLHNMKDKTWDMVILDEAHNLTEGNEVFFKDNGNRIGKLVALTATKPSDKVKLDIFDRLGIEPVYTLSLDEAVKLGVTAPYDITIVTVKLDSKTKYVRAGNEQRRFFTTEEKMYNYYTNVVNAAPSKRAYINRMRFVYNLKSKVDAAQWILEHEIPEDKRTLIFCGSKDQANKLCEYRYYSKPSKPKRGDNSADKSIKYDMEVAEYQGDASLTAFKEGKIDRLSCVAALNEGHNISDLDYGLFVQIDSEERRLLQRLGRILRFRPGHRGKMIIICAAETVDRDWVVRATKGLNVMNIRWVEFEKIKNREEKLFIESSSSG